MGFCVKKGGRSIDMATSIELHPLILFAGDTESANA
jgi:hypothetical protein